MTGRSALLGTGLALLGLLLTGCAVPVAVTQVSDGLPPTPAAAAPVQDGDVTSSLVATPRVTQLAVFPAPGRPYSQLLGHTTPEGGPRALLVDADRGDWLRVLLPGRPNGRHGWIRAGDVDLVATDWHLEVRLAEHQLLVFRGLMQVAEHPVGVGRAVTPTPRGTYYVTDLLRPPNPDGAYGPYAFGLSAYSTVLTSFGGGDGQIGLHGTDDPGSVGKDLSHGCLRLDNAVVRELAAELPLGTPVVIRD